MKTPLIIILVFFVFVILVEIFVLFSYGFYGVIDQKTTDLVFIGTMIFFLIIYVITWQVLKKKESNNESDK
jgi:hypothetical protein